MIYAIHKETKEHRAIEWGDENTDNDDWKLVRAGDDGWISWHGGECPLPVGHPVDVRYRCGESRLGVPAGKLAGGGSMMDASISFWKKDGAIYDIIAYRPILDAKPETPAWDGDGLPPVGCECEYLYSEGNQWREGYCVAHFMGQAVMVDCGDHGAQCCVEQQVRPIRSEEDKSVEEIFKIIYRHDEYRYAAEALYRAGYRKP